MVIFHSYVSLPEGRLVKDSKGQGGCSTHSISDYHRPTESLQPAKQNNVVTLNPPPHVQLSITLKESDCIVRIRTNTRTTKIDYFSLVFEDGYMSRSTALRFPVKWKAQIDQLVVTEFGSGQRRTG
jgi:hypothetical protein